MSDPVAPLSQPAAYYQQMIAAMPVAVIVLNGHGYVAEANAEAVRLLGDPLCGERWLDIIQRCFAPQKMMAMKYRCVMGGGCGWRCLQPMRDSSS
ncbi:hypothetical protein PCI56_11015 [Plesiomonas shigelloides subsp. oncorhynchi]|nr:hypothetical protein [Plesiomonas shigelloides]